MPTYNEGSELNISINAAMLALEKSTFPFEIIAVDDGSNDMHPDSNI